MAYSFVQYIATGGAQYAIPFPYLSVDHLAVVVDGLQTTEFYVTSDGRSIIFNPGFYPANPATVRIARDSSRARRLTTYQDGQVLTKAQMDYDALQIFYVAQEAYDSVAEAPTGGDMRRVNNLSDVFDIAAARENIGAIGKYSNDTVVGRLFMTNTPVAPTEVATKGYVDGLVGGFGSGVTSFNARSGIVTLLTGDVTGALGYTPVNKAGDTMTGALTLSGAPTAALHAATKAYVDGMTPGGTLLTTDNLWSGKNWLTRSEPVDSPNWAVWSMKDGNFVGGDSVPGAGAFVNFDVRKTVDQSVEVTNTRAGAMVRMRVKGQVVLDSVSHAVGSFLDFRGTRLGGVANAGGAVTGSTANRGVDAYTWGVLGEGGGVGTGTAMESYGVIGSMLRQSTSGYQAAMLARVFGGGGFMSADAGVVVAPFGTIASAKAIAAFAAGSLFHGSLVCDYGLDLKYASSTISAIRLAVNKYIDFGSSVTTRYWTGSGFDLWSLDRAGSPLFMVNVGGGSAGTIFSNDGTLGPGSLGSYWLDLGGSRDAVFSYRAAYKAGTPSNTTTAVAWMPVYRDGQKFYTPLMQ